jgi:hypothetical protein
MPDEQKLYPVSMVGLTNEGLNVTYCHNAFQVKAVSEYEAKGKAEAIAESLRQTKTKSVVSVEIGDPTVCWEPKTK